jgi:hypothetical protein
VSATDCRSLAKNARTDADRTMLGDIADEFDAEGEHIEKEEAGSGTLEADDPQVPISPRRVSGGEAVLSL